MAKVKLMGTPKGKSFNIDPFTRGYYSPENLHWLKKNDGKVFEITAFENDYYSLKTGESSVMKVHKMECDIIDENPQQKVETEYDMI